MSKQIATNSWNDGLNKDLNPIITPNTVLTDNLNGTYITYNGNEFSLQTDMGNTYHTRLSNGFYPIGMTEYNGIAYIVSISKTTLKYYKAINSEGIENFKDTIKAAINDAAYGEELLDDTDALALTGDGLLVSNEYLENLITETLSSICELEVREEESNKFEIGSFPSLSTIEESEELEFEQVYRPFNNLLVYNNGRSVVSPFSTSYLPGYDLQHPVSMEIQPSYDGSVNVILTDNKNPVRIINSGFSVLENGKGKFIERNQDAKTNLYDELDLDRLTRLIATSNTFPYIDLGSGEVKGVQSGGRLKGGNYTFYVKFGDEDGNETDIVCESGIVSIFKGTIGKPNTISGTILNEETDKLINLKINNIDSKYSRIYLYYTREYSDLNGYRLSEAIKLREPYSVTGTSQVITISGAEDSETISEEDLNIQYFNVSSAKAIAQQQNMLFLGNVKLDEPDSSDLQDVSYDVEVSIEQGADIGYIDPSTYKSFDDDKYEYYDPKCIYYNLGYWPDELYRLGIVYIKSDGTNTQVYNLRGCKFEFITESNFSDRDFTKEKWVLDPPYDDQEKGHFEEETVHRTHSSAKANPNELWVGGSPISDYLDNSAGIFKTPDINVLESGTLAPLYFKVQMSNDVILRLQSLGITGYFIVRQKRIPITICQGFSVGTSFGYFPMVHYHEDNSDPSKVIDGYFVENFVTQDSNCELFYDPISTSDTPDDYSNAKYYIWNPYVSRGWRLSIVGPNRAKNELDYVYFSYVTLTSGEQGWNEAKGALISLWNAYFPSKDISNDLNTTFEGPNGMRGGVRQLGYNERHKDKQGSTSDGAIYSNVHQGLGWGLLSLEASTNPQIQSLLCGTEFELDPINECSIRKDGTVFTADVYAKTDAESLKAKLVYIPEDTSMKYIDDVGFSTKIGDEFNVNSFGTWKADNTLTKYRKDFVRGKFAPFIGAICKTEDEISPNNIYNIRSQHDASYKLDIKSRSYDISPYYAISNKTILGSGVDVFRGDCFSNTVTIRMHQNFVDSTAPVATTIVKPNAWKKYVIDKADDQDGPKWEEINIADLNTVSLGHWVTFKCLSSTNLGLRAEDNSDTKQMALLGNPKSFYPLVGASTATGMKTGDSLLLNQGYGATVGRKRYVIKQNVPYDKNEFSNRIVFSNVNMSDAFTNGYRVFQGLSYYDYTKQYGAIIKLVPYGENLFCVFEHGIVIIPVNSKALLKTTTEDTIHIYGTGVLTNTISIISQDYGSLWADSIIRTPIGIYGIDTATKKIWKYSDEKGLETISDMKVQRFLNDNINLNLTKGEWIGLTNVKTHYNNYKGDVMFTFYNEDKQWNLCYNERLGKWITRYDWIPMFSVNADNMFYSIELKEFIEDNQISIWKHGSDIKILPANWYGIQHPFEFEFVVTEPNGIHKIFENLQIVSNNVQPKEIEFTLVGDTYLFNRARIYHDYKELYGKSGNDVPYKLDLGIYSKDNFNNVDFSNLFYNARVEYDHVLDEYTLVITQHCKNVDTYGRRLGNIQYKEDGWYTNIEPLRFNINLNNPNVLNFSSSDKFVSTKLRDKWVKIRLKYTGNQLAVINGVITVENISYT